MKPVTPEDIDAVVKFLPLLEDPPEPLYTLRPVSREEDTRKPLDPDPYVFSDRLREFLQALVDHNLVQPCNWIELKEKPYLNDPDRLATASLTTCIKLLTMHVYADRLVAGHLAAVLDSGHMSGILHRLRDLRREMT